MKRDKNLQDRSPGDLSALVALAVLFLAVLLPGRKKPIDYSSAATLQAAPPAQTSLERIATVLTPVLSMVITFFTALVLWWGFEATQRQLALTQQHNELSVAPHLDIQASNIFNAPELLLKEPVKPDLSLVVENNGIGPAILQSIRITDRVTEKPYTDLAQWIQMNEIDFRFLQWNTPATGQYIKEGRSVDLIRVVDWEALNRRPTSEKSKIVTKLSDAFAKLRVAVTYESGYGRSFNLVWPNAKDKPMSPRIERSIENARPPYSSGRS